MSGSTRDKILVTARKLFNEEGYDRVSMRQLADALGISVGNVTYHFKHKQDLVTALMEDTYEKTRLSEPVESLGQFTELLSRMLDTLTRHTFFFLDPAFRNSNTHAFHHTELRELLRKGLDYLTNAGYFLPTFTPDVRETLLTLLLMTHLTWLRQTREPAPPISKATFLRMQWCALKPYLSPSGLAAYADMETRPPLVD